jgi:hypothetical protein
LLVNIDFALDATGDDVRRFLPTEAPAMPRAVMERVPRQQVKAVRVPGAGHLLPIDRNGQTVATRHA